MKKKRTFGLLGLIIMICSMIPSYANTVNEPVLTESVTQETIEDIVNQYAERAIGSETEGAAVAIMNGDKMLFEQYYGYADRDNEVPITSDTVFEWGSTSKILVYISIMQLVEEGKLDLNENIETYLPEGFLKRRTSDAPISLLNLMNHNAGWSDNIRNMMYSDFNDISTLEEQLKLYEPEQSFEVGEGMAYSNFGIGLAGYIVERVSGMPYYEYVETHILKVLSMENTNVFYGQSNRPEIEARRSAIKGYAGERVEQPRLYVAIYPAGSVIGTLEDMTKLARAINPTSESAKLLFKDEASLEKLLETSYWVSPDLPGIAHGLFQKNYAIPVFAHAGHTNAFSAEIAISKDTGFAFVALANQGHESTMTTELEQTLFGEKTWQKNLELPDSKLLEGDYLNYRSTLTGFEKLLVFPIRVTSIDANHILFNGSPAEQVAPYTFVYEDKDQIQKTLYFTVEDGQVQKLSVMGLVEYTPVKTTFKWSRYGLIGVVLISGIYFMIRLLATLLMLLMKRYKNKSYLAGARLLDTFGLLSFLNSLWLFVMISNFTNNHALFPHMILNWVYIIVTLVWFINRFALKKGNAQPIHISEKVTSLFSIIWTLCIVFGEFYH